jgi:hypothetical protein
MFWAFIHLFVVVVASALATVGLLSGAIVMTLFLFSDEIFGRPITASNTPNPDEARDRKRIRAYLHHTDRIAPVNRART